MGYLSDWREAEEAAALAQVSHPDCDRTVDCPADDHLLECVRFRRERSSRSATAQRHTLPTRRARSHPSTLAAEH